MKKAGSGFCLILILILCGCESGKPGEGSSGSNHITENEKIFLELWETFDNHYAFFELRGVDWKDARIKGLELAKTSPSDSVLFDRMSEILKPFNDAHIQLSAPELGLDFNAANTPDFYNEFPTNDSYSVFINSRNQSLGKLGIETLENSESGVFEFGIGKDKQWAYLRIKRFYGDSVENLRKELEQILARASGFEKLIIDIRTNPGGNDPTALMIAGYFFNKDTIVFTKRTRNGPGYEDFSDPDTAIVVSSGEYSISGEEIFLLTNGASSSSADVFALIMAQREEITFVGTPTEGIFSDVFRDTLSNGWTVTLSHQRYFSPGGQCFEGKGIPVDIEIRNDWESAKNGFDPVIDFLSNQ